MPVYRSFSPDDITASESVHMTVDEFEALRLLDAEGLTQEGCASRMNIARTTVTAIYDSARKKVADALVNGKRLLITGGHCEFEPVEIKQVIIEKGKDTMRIAVTYENGEIFQHFGHTEQFKLFDVEGGKIVNEQVVNTNGSGHGALASQMPESNFMQEFRALRTMQQRLWPKEIWSMILMHIVTIMGIITTVTADMNIAVSITAPETDLYLLI